MPFAGNLGSIPCQVIPKTQKMVLDTSLLNTQHYKVWIKVKLSNPSKWLKLPYLGIVAIDKGDFRLPSTADANFTYCSKRMALGLNNSQRLIYH